MPIDGQPTEPFFSRLVSVRDSSDPIEGRLELSEAERTKLTSDLKINSLNRFSFDYRITPAAGEAYRLRGRIAAELTQQCVVTLEPVEERIDEEVELECLPEELIEPEDPVRELEAAIEFDALPEDPPVPIVNGKIDVGALGIELLASALDPYPRKEGVEFDWKDPKTEGEDHPFSPFADLANFRKKN